MTRDEETKWMVVENITTIIATVTLVSAGYYFDVGNMSLFGLLLLFNINYRTE